MQNPFTTTFSKSPEQSYISTDETKEILENFSYKNPSESVYKITGVRGSGKTVIMSKVEEALKAEEGNIVLDINPTRDLLLQTASILSNEKFVKAEIKSGNINISEQILGTGAGFGYSEEKQQYFDIGVEVERMILAAQEAGKRLFFCIDEISKTKQMVEFASEFGKWLRAGYPAYLICTGLFENIENLSNVKNLTFFRRATTIQTQPLNAIKMTEMYKSKLSVSHDVALRMANLTKGYAYAFQELGVLYFKKQPNETLDSLISTYMTELFANSYEKIWKEMSGTDRQYAKIIIEDRPYSREEILKKTGIQNGNYSMYRDRLIKRGIWRCTEHGYVANNLPFFNQYVKDYCC